LKAGEADGLPVLKLDRLSRSTRDVLDLVDESRRQGCGW
jgi:DNA invertase Pin-like site-specific DNA recombinase